MVDIRAVGDGILSKDMVSMPMLTWMVAMLAVQSAAAPPSIGLATLLQDGQVCVSMPAPALAPGTTLTLVQPGLQQSATTATVVRSGTASLCERLETATIAGPYYLAQSAAAPAVASGHVWVAFPGRLATRRESSGAIAVQLNAAHPDAQIRSCTSREGLHLTVWAGTPLSSQRLWHAYYYLGYDTEPSCDDRDVRQ